jgi:hypothetical protein
MDWELYPTSVILHTLLKRGSRMGYVKVTSNAGVHAETLNARARVHQKR